MNGWRMTLGSQHGLLTGESDRGIDQGLMVGQRCNGHCNEKGIFRLRNAAGYSRDYNRIYYRLTYL